MKVLVQYTNIISIKLACSLVTGLSKVRYLLVKCSTTDYTDLKPETLGLHIIKDAFL